MHTLLFLAASVLGAAVPIAGKTLTYREKVGDEIKIHTQVITPVEDSGVERVTFLRGKEGKVFIREEMEIRPGKGTVKWTYHNLENGSEAAAERINNRVYLKGTFNGKKINEKYELKNMSWHQTFFHVPDLTDPEVTYLELCKIGTIKPMIGDFITMKMEVLYSETITIMGKDVVAVKAKINFVGWKSILWKAYGWYRRSDGRALKFESAGAPGKPDSYIKLVNELD